MPRRQAFAAILTQPVDTVYTFFLGGSPFVLVVAQKVYTVFGLVTGQVSIGLDL